MMVASLDVSEIAKEWMKNPAFKAEYDALEEEFSLAAALIRARSGVIGADVVKDHECNATKEAD